MNEESPLDLDRCRERLAARIDWDDQLESALLLAFEAPRDSRCRPRAIDAALRLVEFDIDRPSLLATLLSDPSLKDRLDEERLRRDYGDEVLRLWQDINKLNSLQACNEDSFRTPDQAEKLRRLLMAIIRDVRVMLIKLCYRAARMQRLKYCDYEQRRCLARETLDIYAPLANRLGIGKLKWEMEDLSFRALEPINYKRIARLLEERRADREAFIAGFTRQLSGLIRDQGIEAEVTGRAKHIVSIWRKMQRKNLEFHQLFDVRAVRVLVDTVADCYAVLGIVHTRWHSIPDEFDDYIANPKDNGYQSLHTAVIAEGGKVVEVQIRTHEMHRKSEFGVASHWRYKEGVALDQRMEKSLRKMRELLEDSEDSASDVLEGLSTELSTDRVYVFTPKGQVVDLPAGATPLDFAYSIHSSVGHRCRGAKVNGRIVPLTCQLQTGQEVEILTAKEGGPSRDWMNKNLGYLKSASNRAKVRNWFNHQDFQQNVQDGRTLYEKELARHNLKAVDLSALIAHFKRDDEEQFFADLARGLITVPQIIGHLQKGQVEDDPLQKLRKTGRSSRRGKDDIVIHGVGNLLTQIARCCKPVPGDDIVGYITVGAGVTIHKRDCPNLSALPGEKRARLIEVEWGEGVDSVFQAGIEITAQDRTGLLRDISSVLANERINLLDISSRSDPRHQRVRSRLTIEVPGIDRLVLLMDKLQQIPSVESVRRTS
jgi:GTP pyrophosphokinase